MQNETRMVNRYKQWNAENDGAPEDDWCESE